MVPYFAPNSLQARAGLSSTGQNVNVSVIKFFYFSFILHVLLWGSAISYGQTSATLRLADIPDAVQNNPAWRSARYRIEEARGRLLQSGRLANPTIEFGGRHNAAFREGSLDVAFSQAFPLTARLNLEKAVSAT